MALRTLGWPATVPEGRYVPDRVRRIAEEQAGRALRSAWWRTQPDVLTDARPVFFRVDGILAKAHRLRVQAEQLWAKAEQLQPWSTATPHNVGTPTCSRCRNWQSCGPSTLW
ncbi:hypothetical protein [Streptomyces sp. SYSU K217416]